MKTTTRKPRLTVASLHAYVADHFAQTGETRPSHCTVRCLCNDILDSYSRDGYTVPHGYSQDKAHREVLRALRDTEKEESRAEIRFDPYGGAPYAAN